MTTKPVNLNELNFSELTIGKVNTLDNGGKIAFVNYGEDGGQILTSSGLQDLPWDMNVYEEADGGKSYALSLSFKGRDTNQAPKNFYEGLEKLDDAMLDLGGKNQLEWLKKKGKSKEQVAEDYYTPNVRWGKDKVTGEINTQYPPRFQVKLAKKNGRWTFDAYNQQKEKINLDEVDLETLLVRGAKVKALVKLTTVWTGARGYGCKWAVTQLKVHSTQRFTGYAFGDDSEDDDETEYAAPVVAPVAADDADADDADDEVEEEDEVDEVEEEPEPAPVKKKRIVKKKKPSA